MRFPPSRVFGETVQQVGWIRRFSRSSLLQKLFSRLFLALGQWKLRQDFGCLTRSPFAVVRWENRRHHSDLFPVATGDETGLMRERTETVNGVIIIRQKCRFDPAFTPTEITKAACKQTKQLRFVIG